MLRRNLIANYLGQGWAGLMGLLFIPVYIDHLGMESFALIGVYAVLQAWLTLLDMGMSTTLNREMARFTAGAHTPQSIRDLLRSLEWMGVCMAILIGVVVWSVSAWLASDWLRADKLSTKTIAQAIAIMGWVVAGRLIEGLYRGVLLGLQRQVLFNVINAVFATLRAVGAIAVLAWVSPTIEAYFVWQLVVSLLALLFLGVVAHVCLPAPPSPARFSWAAIRSVWRFAAGMAAVTFLALLLTQVDKMLLSRLLDLQDFGYYALATLVASGLALLINPISQAYYPRFSELVARGDYAGLVGNYHRGAQLVSVLAAPAAMMLIFYGQEILAIWTGDADLAQRVAPLLALLVLGSLLNGMMHIPYMLQLAHGWPGLAVKVNLVAVLVLVPAILWITPRYGSLGAAAVWVVLNAGYVLIGVHFMYRRLLPQEKWVWYRNDVLWPVGAAAVIAAGGKIFQPDDEAWLIQLSWLVIIGVVSMTAAAFSSSEMRFKIAGV